MDKRYDEPQKTFRGNGEVRKNGKRLAQVRYNVTLRQEGIIVGKNEQDLPGHYHAVGTVTVTNNEDFFGEDGLTLHLEDGRSFAISASGFPPTYSIKSIRDDLQDLLRD